MMIDTHTHLYLDQFKNDRKEVLERAINSGIEKILLPNIDSGTIKSMFDLVKDFPGICHPMIGLHPGSVTENYLDELEQINIFRKKNQFIAIGEIGIDLYWDKKFRIQQEKVFSIQIEWAKETGLPIVIHSRESFNEIFKILDELYEPGLKGVFHSFTGGAKEVEKIMEYDFYYGINGIVTFKNSDLGEIVKNIPQERILLETDSPYLSPIPYRGKRNESSYLRYICDFLAKKLGLSYSDMEKLTTRNAIDLFKL